MDDEVTHVEEVAHLPLQVAGSACCLQISDSASNQLETLTFQSLTAAGEYLARHSKIDPSLL